eukprot:jgi/Galph1/5494/GphlegSOOS_G4130.1
METPLPRGKTETSHSKLQHSKSDTEKRKTSSFFDQWLERRKRLRQGKVSSVTKNADGVDDEEAPENSSVFISDQSVMSFGHVSEPHWTGNTLLLTVVKTVNVRTGRIFLSTWNNFVVVCDELQQLLDMSQEKSDQTEEEDDKQNKEETNTLQNNTALIRPGMLLPAIIQHISRQRHYQNIQVSILPRNVNRYIDPWFLLQGCLVYGMMTEKEAYGYRISFGFESVQFEGFLPFEEIENGQCFKLGSLVWCVILQVKKLDKRGIARLSQKRELVCQAKMTLSSKWPFGCIFPGLKMEASFERTKDEHVCVRLASGKGYIPWLPEHKWEKEQKLDLRVVSVDQQKKLVYLSSVECLVHQFEPCLLSNQWKIGQFLENVLVEKYWKNKGLLLREPQSNVKLFAPLSQISDTLTEKDIHSIPLQSCVRCRIIGFSELQSMVIVSMKPSTLSKSVISWEELYPGKKVHCQIENIRENGCICLIEGKVRAWIPTIHFGDTVGKRLKNKFSPGKVGLNIMGRVLRMFSDSHRCVVTAKRKLCEMEENCIITCLKDAKQAMGLKVYCFVCQTSSTNGVQVEFFQGCKGYLPAYYMNLETTPTLQWLQQNFPIGKTLKVWIVSVNEEKQKIIVSLQKDILDLQSSSAVITHGEIIGVENGHLLVQIDWHGNKVAILPKEHLSDFSSLAERIYNLLAFHFQRLKTASSQLSNEPTKIYLDNILILRSHVSASDPRALVSLKLSLIAFARNFPHFPKDIFWDALGSDIMIPGYVERETAHRYLIAFVGNEKLWMDKEELDIPGKLQRRGLQSFETVWCRISQDIHQQWKAFLWRPDDALNVFKYPPNEHQGDISNCFSYYPTRYFEELDSWLVRLGKVMDGDILNQRNVFGQGSCVSATLMSKRDMGSVYVLRNNSVTATGIAIEDTEQEIGSETVVRILDEDLLSGFFIVKPIQHIPSQVPQGIVSATSQWKGIVELMKEEYLVVRIAQDNDRLVYMTSWDPKRRMNWSDWYGIGSQIEDLIVYSGGHQENSRIVLIDESKQYGGKQQTGDEKEKRSNFKIASQVRGKITHISAVYLYVSLGRMEGRLHISQWSEQFVANEMPFRNLKKGDEIDAKVMDIKRKRNNRWMIELSRKDICDGDLNWNSSLLKCKQRLVGFVMKMDANQVVISFSSQVTGVMKGWGWTQDEKLLRSKQVFSSLQPGQALDCTIVEVDVAKRKLQVALTGLVEQSYSIGDSMVGRVVGTRNVTELRIQLPKWMEWYFGTCQAILSWTDVDDDFDKVAMKIPKLMQMEWIRAVVIGTIQGEQQHAAVILSCRSSDKKEKEHSVKDPRWNNNLCDLAPGHLVRGFIRHHSPKGCFIQLSNQIIGRVMLRNLSDGYIAHVEDAFPLGSVVVAKVLQVENSQVELSLRESDLCERETIYSFLKTGQCLQGTVKNIQPFGIFVSLGLGITGLVHLSKLKNEEHKYNVGDMILVEIEKVDKKRINLSLNSSKADNRNGSIPTLQEVVGIPTTTSGMNRHFMTNDIFLEETTSSSEEDVSDNEREALRVTDELSLQTIDKMKDNIIEEPNKISKRITDNYQVEEPSMEQDVEDIEEMQLEQALKEPQTEEDYERLIFASPQDSTGWIRYMAYFVSVGQIQKAKETARRALEKIPFREEKEKRNVWIAFLNLEAQYGEKTDDLFALLDEACTVMEPQEILLRFAQSMQHRNEAIAEQVYQRAIRQLKQSAEVWIQMGTFYYEKQKNIAAGRKTLERALLSLAQLDHLRVITKFAILEYKYGSVERARTIFENMISSFPKRLDIWNIYLDMETKQVSTEDDKEPVRRLFERSCSLSLSSKKMKFLFKKYLEFEKTIGGNPQHVKQLAKEYVETKLQ